MLQPIESLPYGATFVIMDPGSAIRPVCALASTDYLHHYLNMNFQPTEILVFLKPVLWPGLIMSPLGLLRPS